MDNLKHDIEVTLAFKIKSIRADDISIDIELCAGKTVDMCDYPHFLVICKNYGVNIEVYPIANETLGIYIRRRKQK